MRGECLELFCIFIATARSRSFDERRSALKGEMEKAKTSAIPSDLLGAAQELFISYWLDTLVDWAANTNKSLSGASRNNPFIKVGWLLAFALARAPKENNFAPPLKKGKFDPSSMAPRAAPNLFRNKAGERAPPLWYRGQKCRRGRINLILSEHITKLILWSILIVNFWLENSIHNYFCPIWKWQFWWLDIQ